MIKRILKMFFAHDQQRRLNETSVRVHHADRVMSNAMDNLERSTKRLVEVRKSVVDDQMVSIIRELSASMDHRR